ncbi:MAG TPA: hypothetical protein P5217_03070 [Methanoregulaceae archaeon]|nr:hypothetical protein [Methanoregulaceae archaeon]HRY75241.1 hypothetical protein [Methanoregulaceae archaeon]
MSDTRALDSGTLSYDQSAARFIQPLTTGQHGEERALSPNAESLPDELDLFQGFTERHLRPLANGDVQSMLIWAEWVRYHLRAAKDFPRLIREAEFNYLITGLFNTHVALDEHRGRIYPGIRFVP